MTTRPRASTISPHPARTRPCTIDLPAEVGGATAWHANLDVCETMRGAS